MNTKERAKLLKKLHDDYRQANVFNPGDLVTWKEGLASISFEDDPEDDVMVVMHIIPDSEDNLNRAEFENIVCGVIQEGCGGREEFELVTISENRLTHFDPRA